MAAPVRARSPSAADDTRGQCCLTDGWVGRGVSRWREQPSRKEDADALLGALRKKSYNVSEAMNLPHDKLYHVQVGPFADLKEAESARAHLVSDGYNPIVKK